MSDSRDELKEERLRKDDEAAQAERRARLMKLLGAAVAAAVLIVVVAIVLSQSGGDDDEPSQKASAPAGLLDGLPQEGTVLGESSAPVTVVEYGDLQCPFCRDYSQSVIPDVIEGAVRDGDAKLEFKNWVIIGPESLIAARASLAAAEQGRYWQFVEAFYAEQGAENSGYVTDSFLRGIAEDAGVPDLEQWEQDRENPEYTAELRAIDREAQKLGFTGTPSIAIVGPNGTETLGTPESAADIEQAIADAR